MCGILFGLSDRRLVLPDYISALEFIGHRGPDFKDFRVFDDQKVFMGHSRLKILDLSSMGNQPFSSSDGRYTVIYNGEIYNFLDLRNELSNDYEFKTNCDTEIIIPLFCKYGKSMLEKIDGMFAFCIFDSISGNVFAARDRFGIKPFFFHFNGREFFAASEIPPLLKIIKKSEPNLTVLKSYLSYGSYEVGNQTFFKNIYTLQPGHFLEFNSRTPKIFCQKWYFLESKLLNLGNKNYQDILLETEIGIKKAVSSHCLSDVEIGVNLSGGVDSSLLLEIMSESVQQEKLKSFTQDWPEGYSERPWVELMCRDKTVVSHFSAVTPGDIIERIKDTVASQAEPFGGLTVVGYDFLYELASSENVKVLLDGNGIDEVFLGYQKYQFIYLRHLIKHDSSSRRIDQLISAWKLNPKSIKKSLDCTHASIDGSNPVSNTTLLGRELIGVDCEAPIQNPYTSCPVRNAAINDLLHYKIPRGLRFNDRISMAHGRELRVPFLDHRLVEFGSSIPTPLLINENGSKSIIRDIASKRIPNSLSYAPKRSVQSPQREWLAKDLKVLIQDTLSSRTFIDRGWIDSTLATKAFDEYMNGARENSFHIWQWLNLELWANHFFD